MDQLLSHDTLTRARVTRPNERGRRAARSLGDVSSFSENVSSARSAGVRGSQIDRVEAESRNMHL
eukprot:scaffold69309_cov65-Phaeocystis_antarctica.AAC.10